jgi:hypothetical protein
MLSPEKIKTHQKKLLLGFGYAGSPKGNRTPVSAVRGRHPRPLDDGAIWQPDKDSNPGELIQSQSCYHYTIRLYPGLTRRELL